MTLVGLVLLQFGHQTRPSHNPDLVTVVQFSKPHAIALDTRLLRDTERRRMTRYYYEALNDDSFQKLAQALIAVDHPNVQCLPLGQADGGRDALVPRAFSRARLPRRRLRCIPSKVCQ